MVIVGSDAVGPTDFANKTICVTKAPLNELADTRVIEASQTWVQPKPYFVDDQSGNGTPEWLMKAHAYTKHATVFVSRKNVLLFGSNHVIDCDGRWQCESDNFAQQYIDFYQSKTFSHFFPGDKPSFSRDGSQLWLNCELITASNIHILKEEVYLATPHEPDNWGRWISTVIPKLVYYKNNGLNCRILLRCEKKWQHALLDELEIPRDRIISHDPGRVYFCMSLLTLCYSATDLTPSLNESKIYGRIRDRLIRLPRPHLPERLFVSRLSWSKAHPNHRRLENEVELINAFEERGFCVIEPELLSFSDQVQLFGSARVIIGLGGSGMFNAVFARLPANVVTLEASYRFLPEHSRLFAAVSSGYGVIIGRQRVVAERTGHTNWMVDVDRVIKATSLASWE